MSNLLFIPPSFLMLFGALLLPAFSKEKRPYLFLLFPLFVLVQLFFIELGTTVSYEFMNYTLTLTKYDTVSRIFTFIFALATLITGIYGLHVKDLMQQIVALIYGGATIGMTLAGDYFTLIIYWEIMAIASTLLVWSNHSERSQKAGMRYFFYHLLGGGILLAGIILHVAKTGSIEIIPLGYDKSLSASLMLIGIIINAAVPPLSAWLSDAYPKATITGTIFLSSFTTKAAVYLLVRLFPGHELLIYLGTFMALYGIFYTIIVGDMQEILSYHIISQVGYMVAAVGIGTELSINGSIAHAICNVLFKSLLFMATGAVIFTTGRRKFSELGHSWKLQPMVAVLYMIGAFSISGFPFFNGFISKSIIIESAGQTHNETVMLLLLLASVGTFLSVGIKLPYLTWLGTNNNLKPTKTPTSMYIGMWILALSCFGLGVYPDLLYRFLPFTMDYTPFTGHHFSEIIQIVVFTFLAFLLIRKKFKASLSQDHTVLDTDWFYRVPGKKAGILLVAWINNFFELSQSVIMSGVKSIKAFIYDIVPPKLSRIEGSYLLGFILLIFLYTVFLGNY